MKEFQTNVLCISLLFSSFCVQIECQPERNWKLYKLDMSLYPEAICLDGSPGGFYVLPGVGEGASTFLLHLTGGGWCTDLNSCRLRAFEGPVYQYQASLGSSINWGPGECSKELANNTQPCVGDGGSGGILSSNQTINPNFWQATKVWLAYCSGDSFSGSRSAPLPVNATHSVYFRGDAILRASLATLATNHGLSSATAVILKGCSAGGVATYFQADAVGKILSKLAPNARYAALPGAGVFLQYPSYAGPNLDDAVFQWIFYNSNMTGTGNTDCTRDLGPPAAWKCLYAVTLFKYIKTPLFVANSLADAASQSFIMALPCSLADGTCNPQELAYVDAFSSTMAANVSTLVTAPGSPHGAFLLTCSVHMIENIDGDLNNIIVQGRSFNDVFSSWWNKNSGEQYYAIDDVWTKGKGVHGGNADCSYYGPVPSLP
jgi:hypothetical protein